MIRTSLALLPMVALAACVGGRAIPQGTTDPIVAPGTYSAAHVNWCFRNRTDYEVADNTYARSSDWRQQCNSPFGGPPRGSPLR